MRLSLLTEDIQRTLEILIDKYHDVVSSGTIRDICDKAPDELYAEWVVKQVADDTLIWPEDHDRATQAYTYFLSNKSDASYKELAEDLGIQNPNNILTYDFRDVWDIIEHSWHESAEPEQTSNRKHNQKIKKSGSRLFYNGSGWSIIEITTSAAMVIYAKGTRWCVSDQDIAQRYLDRGRLFLFTKDNHKEALFHGNKDGKQSQFMDIKDRPYENGDVDQIIIDSGLYNECTQILNYVNLVRNEDYIKNDRRLYDILKNNPMIVINFAEHYGDTSKFLERFVVDRPYYAVFYAQNVKGRRWPEAEPGIMHDPKQAAFYAYMVIGNRWPEAEPHIKYDSEAAVYYAHKVLERRWPDAEPYIALHPRSALDYAQFLDFRFREAEPNVLKSHTIRMIYATTIVQEPWPELEIELLNDPAPIELLEYVENCRIDRWLEAEPHIIEEPDLAVRYAAQFIGGRWPEAETNILKSPHAILNYVALIIKGRWLEAEPTLRKDAQNWLSYKKLIN